MRSQDRQTVPFAGRSARPSQAQVWHDQTSPTGAIVTARKERLLDLDNLATNLRASPESFYNAAFLNRHMVPLVRRSVRNGGSK